MLVAGAAVLLLGSQWPQLRAPWPTADGLARPDLQALAVVGGSMWAQSLVVHAWTAAAIGVAIAHGWRGPRADWRAWVVRVAVALAIGAGLTWLTLQGAAPDPLWIDVPIAAEAGTPTLPLAEAWRNDHGSLAPAAGPFRGRCAPVTSAELRCQVVGPGLQLETAVGVQTAGAAAPARVHWLATLAAPADAWTWQPPTGDGRPIAVPLRPGQVVAVPDWGQRRAVPVDSQVAGPAVVTLGADGSRLWAAPRLVGPGGAVATQRRTELVAGGRARLLVAGPLAGLPAWLAAVGLVLLAVLAAGRRRAEP